MSDAEARPPVKLGVLISGEGTNLQALIDAVARGELRAAIRVVIANQANPAGSTGLGAFRGREVIYVITASSRFVDQSLGFFAFLRLNIPVISVSHSERAIGSG